MTDIAVLGMQIDAKALDAGLERLEQAFARVGKSGDEMVAQVKTATGAVGKAMSDAMGGGTGGTGAMKQAEAGYVAYQKRLAQSVVQQEKLIRAAQVEDSRRSITLQLEEEKMMRLRSAQEIRQAVSRIGTPTTGLSASSFMSASEADRANAKIRENEVLMTAQMQRSAQVEDKVRSAKSALVLAESEANNSIASIGRRFAALTWEATRIIYGITALGTAALAPAIFGTKFQKDIEDSRVGITGILVAMTDLNGKATTINDAWRISGDIVNRLQADAIKYGISLSQIATTYRAILAPALGAGLKMPQIEKIASVGAVAVSAIGLPVQQQVQEIRDLITGGIQASQNTLATALGITGKDIIEAKKHVNGLYDLVYGRMADFATVAEAMRSKTLTGAWDVMLNKIQRLVTDPGGFSALKDAINSASNYIERMNTTTGKMEFNPALVSQVTMYWNTLKTIGSALGTIASLTAAILPAAIKVGEAFILWKIAGAVAEMQLFSKAVAGMKVLEVVTGIKSMNEALLATGVAASAAKSRIAAMSVGTKGGLIGLALWGAYEIADYVGAFDNIFGAAEKRMAEFKTKVKENTDTVSVAAQLSAVESELKPILDRHLSSTSPRERELLQQRDILKAQLKANSAQSADEVRLRSAIALSDAKKVSDGFVPTNDAQAHADKILAIHKAFDTTVALMTDKSAIEIERKKEARAIAAVKAPKVHADKTDSPAEIEAARAKGAQDVLVNDYRNSVQELSVLRDDELISNEQYVRAKRSYAEAEATATMNGLDAEIKAEKQGSVKYEQLRARKLQAIADLNSAASISEQDARRAREQDGKKEIDDITTKYDALIAVQENYRAELKKSVSQGDVPKAQGDLRDEAFTKRIIQLYRDEQTALKGVAVGNDTVRGQVDKLTASLEKNAIAASKAYRPTWVDGAKQAYANYANAAGDAAQQSEQAFSNMFKGMEDSLTSFVTTGTLDFAKLRDSIIADLVRIQMRAMISSIFQFLTPTPAPAAGATAGVSQYSLSSGGSGFGLKAANGAMFDGGISAFANGGVVNAPTNFAFASGGSTKAGLMGEAGPEAIMPLSRGSDGKLGVKMQGGGQTIQITNAPVIHIDARSDQAQVHKMVTGAVQQGNAQLVDTLQRRGVL